MLYAKIDTALIFLVSSWMCCGAFVGAQDTLFITEFMAANGGALLDEDGDSSDWIELHNADSDPVDLDGWILTDDPLHLSGWTIPPETLPAQGFLILFASGKDRSVPGLPLHTDFQLDAAGEYLALLKPDGKTVAQAFSPSFPPQIEGVSYGLDALQARTTFVERGNQARWLVPSSPSDLAGDWTLPIFDDSSWARGPIGLGFDLTQTNPPPPTDLTNLALGQPVSQSSTRDSFEPELAVNSSPADFTHTIAGENLPSTWEVDLAGTYDLETIVLYNRPSHASRLRDITVQILDAADSILYASPLLNPENVLGDGELGSGPLTLTLDLPTLTGSRISGSRVRVIRAPDPDLSGTDGQGTTSEPDTLCLAEVEVWGSTPQSLADAIESNVASGMHGVNPSALVRIPFTIPVEEMPLLDRLDLQIRYDDGFIARLNGIEVARRNAPVAPDWNSTATAENVDPGPLGFEVIDVSPSLNLLQEGENTLAIHALNLASDDPDFLLFPELIGSLLTTSAERYLAAPTPSLPNGESYLGIVTEVEFSTDRGLFSEPFTITITTDTPGAEIRYTTDGSPPSASTGHIFTAPIEVSRSTVIRALATRPGYRSSEVATHTYVLVDEAINQSSANSIQGGWPSTWASIPADYDMDPRITGPNAAQMEAALRSIPNVFLTTTRSNLFDPANGIYTHPNEHGEAWERPASAELVNTNGQTAFQIDCGLRIQGGWFRPLDRARKDSFRLLFKQAYGPGKLRHRLFPDPQATKEFDTLVLRAGANDGYAWSAAKDTEQYTRDEFGRQLQLALGHPAPHGLFVHLYLNGLYWGLYNLVERPNEDFSASYFGGEAEDWDANNAGNTKNGDQAAWDAFIHLVQQPTSPENYQRLQGNNPDGSRNPSYPVYLDMPNYADYMILNIWAGNWDWPHKNFWFGRHRSPDSTGFKFYTWDFENTIGNNRSRSPTNMVSPRSSVANSRVGQPHYQLKNDLDYRLLFADRVHRAFFNGGLLTPTALTDRYRHLADHVELAIITESARWGDDHWDPPQDITDWRRERDWVLNTYLPVRSAIVLEQFRSDGLYPSLNAPSFNQFGGSVPAGFTLELSHNNSSGTIFYTLDGSDPRLAGSGQVSPAASPYSLPLSVTAPTLARARVQANGQWSALTEAMFYPPQDLNALTLTEIMYHAPNDPPLNSGAFDFLELKNTGSNPLDLSGLAFTAGITFTFSNATRLPPGSFVVLVSDPTAFANRYPTTTIQGVYSGDLDNSGETLTLTHPLGGTVLSVTYNDRPPWPVTPDGLGFSLVQTDPTGSQAPDRARRWRASTTPLGSPGTDDSPSPIPGIVINEILAHTDLPQVDALELHNPTEFDADISGWFLTDDSTSPQKYRIADHTLLPSGAYQVFDASQFNANPGTASSFGLSSLGETLHLFSANPIGALTGYDHGIPFGASFNGVSFGRWLGSDGEEHFPLQTSVTLGTLNATPYLSPVVITEIHYHPPTDGGEFVELYNHTDEPVTLFDPAAPTNTWQIGGLDFTFPEGLSLNPEGILIVTAADPDLFRAAYSVPPQVIVLGPVLGQLQNEGERLQLLAPDTPGTNGVPYVALESIRYNDQEPWPTAADGTGPSLHRLHPKVFGSDPSHWISSHPTPGFLIGSGDADLDGLPDDWELLHGTHWTIPDADADPDRDGATNSEEHAAGTHPLDPDSALRLTIRTSVQGDSLHLDFQAQADRSYNLLSAPTAQGPWTPIWEEPARQDPEPITLIVEPLPPAGRFYRLRCPAE